MKSEDTRLLLQTIGGQIKNIRERKKLSLESVSMSSGLTTEQITDLEEGKWDAPLETLVALAEGLGVRPKDIWDTDFSSISTGPPER